MRSKHYSQVIIQISTLTELIEYHNLSQFPVLSTSTRKCYIITKNYITSFLNQKGSTVIQTKY